jgi:fused signal recognition particle receptor
MIWGLFDKKKAAAEEAAERKGLFDGLRKSSAKLAESFTSVFTKEKLDAAELSELEDALIASDMGAPAAHRIAQALADRRFSKETDGTDAREALASEVAKVLAPREAHLDLQNGPKPLIVLVIGVNGSGKTTTLGKLSKLLRDADA